MRFVVAFVEIFAAILLFWFIAHWFDHLVCGGPYLIGYVWDMVTISWSFVIIILLVARATYNAQLD